MAPQAQPRSSRRNRLKADPTERIAGLAFFVMILLQIPFLIVDSELAASGLVVLSPAQITAASLAKQFPALHHYIDDVLIPGTWMRESLSPYIQCQFKTGTKGPCEQQTARLLDLQYVRNGTNLPLLVELFDGPGVSAQPFLVYGSYLIVVSALFSLYYTVKSAVLGFVLLGYGIYAGNHLPMPPMVLVGFLCVYAGFNLGQPRGGGASVQQLKQRGTAQQGQQPGSSKGTPQKAPSKGSSTARKQRKAA